MDIDGYTNPSGELREAPPYGYSFIPNLLPPEIDIPLQILDKSLSLERRLLEIDIDRIDHFKDVASFKNSVQNLFLVREALHSSNIEGTTANFDEIIYLDKDDPNYFVKGLNEVYSNQGAIEYLLGVVSQSDILNMNHLANCHKVLMTDILRGSSRNMAKSVGLIRENQNCIRNSKGDIVFIPPPVGVRFDDLIGNFDQYLNQKHHSGHKIIAIANAHYQFETIHPFDDGNGRVGRALIQALLIKYGLIDQPLIDLSGYLLKNKTDYVGCLIDVGTKSDWIKLYSFFLDEVQYQVDDSKKILSGLLKIVAETLDKIRYKDGRVTVELCDIINFTLRNPVFTVNDISKKLSINYNTARNNVSRLENIGYCRQVNVDNKIKYVCGEVISLFLS